MSRLGASMDAHCLKNAGCRSLDDAAFLPAYQAPIHEPESKYSLGQVIRLLRKEKGFSQEELAKRAQVDRTTIARVECGIFKTLSVEKLEKIAAAVETDLKALLLKSDVTDESMMHRSQLSHVEFSLDYPEDGFRITSHIPKRKEFFFGKIEVCPAKAISSEKLPHPEQIYLHCLDGKVLLTRSQKEFLLRPGDCFVFCGFKDYEIFNPEQMKTTSALFITHPSFLAI